MTNLAVDLLELVHVVGKSDNLSGADEGEVERVEKHDHILAAVILSKLTRIKFVLNIQVITIIFEAKQLVNEVHLVEFYSYKPFFTSREISLKAPFTTA